MTNLADWIAERFGYRPGELALFERALSHSSAGRDSYERLEFLGDRVLGLVVAKWLFDRFPQEAEGQMSQRYNALVARETCAEVGREIGVPAIVRLGKQAREDGANASDNVIGDVVEALLGALYVDAGLQPCENFIQSQWAAYVEQQKRAPQNPKSALQELAAARGWKPPEYEVVARSGAHHAPTFKVKVTVRGGGGAEADGSSKQEAEKLAAAQLLEKLK
jgi:ribonuclease-3